MSKSTLPKPYIAVRTEGPTSNIARRYFVRAGLIIVAALVLIFVLNRFSDIEFPLICWRCRESIYITCAIVLLAALQQIVFSAASIRVIPGMRRTGVFAIVLAIVLITSLINVVAPAKAGTVLRGVLFKDRMGVPYEVFLGSQSALTAITFLVATPAVLAILVLAKNYSASATLVAGGLLVALLVISLSPGANIWGDGESRVTRGMKRISGALRDPILNPHTLAWVVGLSSIQFLIVAARAGLSLALVGANYSPTAAIAVAAALVVAPMLAFLPGGIGTRELLFSTAALITGVSIELALAAALADRAIGTLALALMAIPSIWHLNRTDSLSRT